MEIFARFECLESRHRCFSGSCSNVIIQCSTSQLFFKSCRIWVSFQFNVISSHFGNGDHILNICNRIIDSSIVAFCKFDFRSNIFGIHFFFEAYDDEAFPSLRSTIMDCVKRIFA